MDTLVSRIFTKSFLVTAVRYGLNALGVWLVTEGKLDAGSWETISGAILVIITTTMGGIEASKDKAVLDGKSVPMDKLPASTRADVKEAVAQPRKRRSFFDMLVGK